MTWLLLAVTSVGCHLVSGITDKDFGDATGASAAGGEGGESSADGAGGATGTTGSTGQGGAPGGGSATGGETAWTCGDVPEPTGIACPAACTGGCEQDVCIIDCSGKDGCREEVIDCPEGLACEVDCDGDSACRDVTLQCPDDYPCGVTCSDWMSHSCENMAILCSERGNCSLTCNEAYNGCTGTTVTCGLGLCTATCPKWADKPAVECGDSCECQDNCPG